MPKKRKKSNNMKGMHYIIIIAVIIFCVIFIVSQAKGDFKQGIKREVSQYCIDVSEGVCEDHTGKYENQCNSDREYMTFYCDGDKCTSTSVSCAEDQICENGNCVQKTTEVMGRVPVHTKCEEFRCIFVEGEGDDQCVTDDDCECVCDSGYCCDGCYYRPSNFICSSQFEKDFGCPWGNECGSDVGLRYKVRYCPGDATTCTGEVSDWGEWTTFAECHNRQICIDGVASCKYNPKCL